MSTSHRQGAASGGRLRHPAEVPFFVFTAVLNLSIVVVIVRAAVKLPYLPDRFQDSGWAIAVRSALIALLLIPVLVIVRETQRATIRGAAVELFYLANGNGTLNAFAARATGHDYVVLSTELFANLRSDNREGLRFILGRELGHVRLHHVSLWYQLAVAYLERIPLLGPLLSRLRECSCGQQGAYLEALGDKGLVLLASGRHTEDVVDVDHLVRQGANLHGFWVGLAQLPRSHPFTVRRLTRLYRLGLIPPRVRSAESETSV